MQLFHRCIEDWMESNRRVKKEIKKRAKILFCPFEKCRYYNKLDRNYIALMKKYGKDEHMNLHQCKTCKRNFYKRRDTLLFYVKLT